MFHTQDDPTTFGASVVGYAEMLLRCYSMTNWVNSRCWKFIYELQTIELRWNLCGLNPYNELQVWYSLQRKVRSLKRNIIHTNSVDNLDKLSTGLPVTTNHPEIWKVSLITYPFYSFIIRLMNIPTTFVLSFKIKGHRKSNFH